MARLIDAEPLCKTLDDLSNENMGIGLPQMASGINTAICQINAALTVDAVEVVRCKDCIYWDKHMSQDGKFEFTNLSCCKMGIYGDGRNFYCSRGERKDNAE